MKKSNSYLNYKYISNGVRPKLTKNPWLTNSSTASDYKYIRGEKFLPRNYMILNRDKLKNIENNYFDMRYLLNDKINRLEKNQRRFNEILKYSLEQNRMQNDINSFNYNKHMQNYEDKNKLEKDYLLKMINQMPEMIENKIDRIFQDEYESSQNQKNFIENLKERMLSEIKNQRRYDYMRYRQQLKELMILKENEEKEKLRLLNEIQQQKLKYKIREMKYQNGMNRYNNYNNPFYGFPPILPPMYPINAPTPQNNNSIGSSIDEFMKVFLFKEMMGSLQKYNDYQNYMSDILPNMYIGLEDMDGFRKYKRYKNRNRPRKKDSFYHSEIFNDYKKYGDNGEYSFNDSKLPFINTGKSLSRKKESNSNNRLRFMTSHLSNNKKETNETKKTRDTKESKESKEKKKESTSSQKSSSKKSSEDENSSSSGGSEDSNENSEDDDNNSNSEDESENSSEEKKDENNNNNKEKNEEKTEEKKEENNNQEKKENEDKKNEEAQKPIINLAETPQQN